MLHSFIGNIDIADSTQFEDVHINYFCRTVNGLHTQPCYAGVNTVSTETKMRVEALCKAQRQNPSYPSPVLPRHITNLYIM